MDLDVQIGIFRELGDTASLLPALEKMATVAQPQVCVIGGRCLQLLGYTHYSLGKPTIAHNFF